MSNPANRPARTSIPAGPFAALPTQFGRYRIEKLLGNGTVGATYLAHDTILDRPVALKAVVVSRSGVGPILKRMQAEAKAAAKIDHPFICEIYDSGEIGGIRFIAMQHVSGEDLRQYLSRVGPCREPDDAVQIVLNLLRALEAAHRKGVVHRNLKPENVMLKPDGRPVIMEFGLARQMGQTSDAGLTREGMVLGAANYMSPEQIRGSSEIDGRSDIYAIGVMLFELLTGNLPFTGTTIEILGKKCAHEAPSPLILQPALPPALAAVCLKMIAQSHEDRYASCTEVIAALKNPESPFEYLRDRADTPLKPTTLATGSKTIPSASFTSILVPLRSSLAPLATWWNRQSPELCRAVFAGASVVLLFLVGMLWLRSNRTSTRPADPGIAMAETKPSTSRWVGPWRTAHLLDTTNVRRDAVNGEWKLDNGHLTQTAAIDAQIELPISTPDEYSFSFEGSRSPAAPVYDRSLGIVLPILGRSVMVRIDADDEGGLSGLVANDKGDWEEATLVPGQQLPDREKFYVRCIVRKDSIDVFWQGRRRIHRVGKPTELGCPAKHHPRETPGIVLVCQGPYEFAKLRLSPLELSLTDEVDLLKLVDVQRDTLQDSFQEVGDGIETVNGDGTLDSILELPVEPPAEYTLRVTAKRMSTIHHVIIGLVVAGQPVDAVFDLDTAAGGGLELFDGRVAMQGPTAISSSNFIDQVPFDLECRVSRSHVCVLSGARLLIDWPIDVARFSRPKSHTNSIGLLLGGASSSYRFTRVRLGPLQKLEPRPEPVPSGQTIDLLGMIDPGRDTFHGKFTKNVDGSLTLPNTLRNSQLCVPLDLPAEYELYAEIQSPEGGGDLVLGLPAAGGKGALIADAYAHSWSGLDVDAHFPSNVTLRNGNFLSQGRHELTVRVARTGIQCLCDQTTMIDWRGNPRRLQHSAFRYGPGENRLGIGSWETAYRFTKLELRPLPTIPAPFASVHKPINGDLLDVIDPDRDSIDGQWKKEGAALLAPWNQHDHRSVLHVPYELGDEYEITAKMQRREGTDAFVADVPVGNGRCRVIFDGWSSSIFRSGIDWIDGTDPTTNGTGQTGPCLPAGIINELRVRVEREHLGRYLVQGFVGNAKVNSWRGYPSQLTSDFHPLPSEERDLFLRTYAGFTISELTYRPLTSKKQASSFEGERATWQEVPLAIRLHRDWPKLRKLALEWEVKWFRLPNDVQQLLAEFPRIDDSSFDAKTTCSSLKMSSFELDRNPLNQLDWFGFRARTTVTLPAGKYAVFSEADDGVRIRVNGQVVFEHWAGRENGWSNITEFAVPEGPTTLQVDYFELQRANQCTVEFAAVDGSPLKTR